MPISVENSIATALQFRQTQRLANLWRITRTDGVQLRFTDHNTEVLFSDEIFTPSGGGNVSAEEKALGVDRVANVELMGIIDSEAITEEDIRAGKYRDAQIEYWLVDWMYPWAGTFYKRKYTISDIRFSEFGWKAAMEGLGGLLQHEVGRSVNRKCRYDLGQAIIDGEGCGVNLATFTVTGDVTSVSSRRHFIGSTHSVFTDGRFKHGLLTWTSGNNNGLSFEIQKYTSSSPARGFWQYLPAPFDIQVGDSYSVYAGCDKEFSTCVGTFSNGDKFGGFPYVPGTDAVLRGPSIKRG